MSTTKPIHKSAEEQKRIIEKIIKADFVKLDIKKKSQTMHVDVKELQEKFAMALEEPKIVSQSNVDGDTANEFILKHSLSNIELNNVVDSHLMAKNQLINLQPYDNTPVLKNIHTDILSILDKNLEFINVMSELNDTEVSDYHSELSRKLNTVLDDTKNYAEVISANNYDTNNVFDVYKTPLICAIMESAIGMIQLNTSQANTQALYSTFANQLLTDMGQLQQITAWLDGIYKDRLNKMNEQATKDKTGSNYTQVSWSDLNGASGDGWKSDGNGGIIVDKDKIPPLLKEFATPSFNGKSYTVTMANIQEAIKKVSKELAFLVPNTGSNEDNADTSNGELYNTYKESCGNNVELESFSGALSNKLKIVNDKIANFSSQIQLNQSNIQPLISTFEQALSLYSQTMSRA